ncbi:unnamed protein product [Effrenium voratum]|nr:unnamed protein product [Effrenium voratum]
MDDMADLSWQQLRADLEDLEAQLSGASTSAGRLTAGIGSRLLSPKKGGKLAPLKKTEPDVSKDLAQAAGSFLQASEALAKIRQRQLEETNPMSFDWGKQCQTSRPWRSWRRMWQRRWPIVEVKETRRPLCNCSGRNCRKSLQRRAPQLRRTKT